MCECKKTYVEVTDVKGVVGKYVCNECNFEHLVYDFSESMGHQISVFRGMRVDIYKDVKPVAVISFTSDKGKTYYDSHRDKARHLKGPKFSKELDKAILNWIRNNDDNISIAVYEMDEGLELTQIK